VREVPLDMLGIKKFIRKRSPFNHPSVMFRKKAVLAVGGYSNLTVCEDYDLWIRMTAKGLKMKNLPDILVNSRIDDTSYRRRGGWKYYKSNKMLQDNLLDLKMILVWHYSVNIVIRFTVQVLMPNTLRGLFYNNILRSSKSSQ
jgi:hypothetical protein